VETLNLWLLLAVSAPCALAIGVLTATVLMAPQASRAAANRALRGGG
jgi:hypothetical protein